MASEQGESTPLPGDIEEWVADHTDDTGEDRADVLARAVTSYRLLTEDAGDEPPASKLAAVQSRIDTLEAELEDLDNGVEKDHIQELEAELEDHVEDLRSRIVDVLKEARSRAPADHSHESLEERLDEQASATDELRQTLDEQASTTDELQQSLTEQASTTDELRQSLTEQASRTDELRKSLDDQASSTDELRESLDELTAEFEQFDKSVDKRLTASEDELGDVSESVSELESKADTLAGAVVDLRRRLGQVETHVSHQTALSELLQTAGREGISRAECDNCGEKVDLRLLGKPSCPHCNSVFETVEPGSMFLKSATLIVADRPELEAGETDESFELNGTTTAEESTPHESQ